MSLYEIPIASLDGTPDLLKDQQGHVTLMVNVASKCHAGSLSSASRATSSWARNRARQRRSKSSAARRTG